MIDAGQMWRELWTYLQPECVLLLGGLLVLLFDLVTHRPRVLFVISLFTTALAAVLALFAPVSREAIFMGMITPDGFAQFFRLFAAMVGFMVVLMSWDYKALPRDFIAEYLGLFLLMLSGVMFLAAATNLLLVFLALEFVSLTSYLLVGFLRDNPRSKEASLKYFLFGAVCTAVLLYGFSLLYGLTGSLDLPVIAGVLAQRQNSPITALIMLFLLAGFGFKIAMAPFHAWVPDTYEGAPTPITAFLSVGSKAAGFSVLLRVFYTIFPMLDYHQYWMIVVGVLAAVTMTLANVIACSQYNLKRLLGYSSIAQAGYVLMAFVVMDSVLSRSAVMIYLFAYLFMNLGAFAVIIMIGNAAGHEDLDDVSGLGQRHPVLAWSLFIFFLSLAGIPPLGGWIGKYAIFATLLKGYLEGVTGGNLMLWFAVILAVNAVVAVVYYFRVVKAMFFEPVLGRTPKVATPLPLMAVVVISLVFTFAVGLWPQPFWDWVSRMTL